MFDTVPPESQQQQQQKYSSIEQLNQINQRRQVNMKTCADVYDYWRTCKRFYKKAPKDGVEFQVDYIDTGLAFNDELRSKMPIALALHGAPGSYDDFKLLINHLSQQKVRVIAPNFPEYIATVKTKVLFRHSADEKAAYLRDFLKAINVYKIDLLVSHSSAIFPTLLILLNANNEAIARQKQQKQLQQKLLETNLCQQQPQNGDNKENLDKSSKAIARQQKSSIVEDVSTTRKITDTINQNQNLAKSVSNGDGDFSNNNNYESEEEENGEEEENFEDAKDEIDNNNNNLSIRQNTNSTIDNNSCSNNNDINDSDNKKQVTLQQVVDFDGKIIQDKQNNRRRGKEDKKERNSKKSKSIKSQDVVVKFDQPIEIKAVALFNPAGHRLPKSMKPTWFKCGSVHVYQHKLGRSIFRKFGPAFLTVIGVPVHVDNMDNVMLSATVMRNSKCQRVVKQLEQLSQLKMPTLLVFSENDKLIEKEIFYEMSQFMKLDEKNFDIFNNDGDIELSRKYTFYISIYWNGA